MPINPKLVRKSTSNEMGVVAALSPVTLAESILGAPSANPQKSVRPKSASVESRIVPSIICSSLNLYDGPEMLEASSEDCLARNEEDRDNLGFGSRWDRSRKELARGNQRSNTPTPVIERDDDGKDKCAKRTVSQDSLMGSASVNPLVGSGGVASLKSRTKNLFANRSFLLPFGGALEARDSRREHGHDKFAPLRPSVSTSCLFSGFNEGAGASGEPVISLGPNESRSAGESSKSSNTSQVCVPTRASLTHEWRKLKTPNKCRECNLLVYFNGRECSCCGFVAHKKCIMVLVIKCSGRMVGQQQKHDPLSGGIGLSFFLRNQNIQPMGNSESDKKDERSLLAAPRTNTFMASPGAPCAPSVRPIFGQPIVDIDGERMVDFVNRFVYEIDTRGLTSKGIYRVSSIKSKVDRLCNYYDQNLSSLIDLSSFHPNIIANALKMYLRRLPEPLLTQKLYAGFIQIAKKYSTPTAAAATTATVAGTSQNPARTSPTSPMSRPVTSMSCSMMGGRLGGSGDGNRNNIASKQQLLQQPQHRSMIDRARPERGEMTMIAEFRRLIGELPATNREIVAIIMRHLRRVSDMEEENQMSAKNLSIIFGPTLLNAAENKSLAIVDNIHQARVVELMIIWAYQIFPQP